MTNGFIKITNANGFDNENKDNGMQNNYACSLGELGDYIYVGTARNVLYELIRGKFFGDIKVPDVLTPKQVDSLGEIWRYKKDGSEPWKKVFKSSEEMGISKVLCMFTHSAKNTPRTLYCITTAKDGVILLKTTDGEEWTALPMGIAKDVHRASIIIHERHYYISLYSINTIEPLLFVTNNPEKEWQKINLDGDINRNPQGNISSMLSFNDHLYVGCAKSGGFEIWKTRGRYPLLNDWKLIVDKGAGNELNEYPCSMVAFKNNIFVGSGTIPFVSMNKTRAFVLPKGFDLIRINKTDRWSHVIGGNNPESGLHSGFDKITNAYCFTMKAHGDRLYIGTYNWSTIIPSAISSIKDLFLTEKPSASKVIKNNNSEKWSSLFNTVLSSVFSMLTSYGFDLWETEDGSKWKPITTTGFATSENLGVSDMVISSDGRMYVGTANPFNGCEVWSKKIHDNTRSQLKTFSKKSRSSHRH